MLAHRNFAVDVVDGYRESTQPWRELLQQLKRLGLSTAPKLAIGDGSLGFWIALQEEYCPVAQQRCWVHKTANGADSPPRTSKNSKTYWIKMPKTVQGNAKQLIHEMYGELPERGCARFNVGSHINRPNFRCERILLMAQALTFDGIT